MIPVPQKKGRGRPRKYLRLEDVLEWRLKKEKSGSDPGLSPGPGPVRKLETSLKEDPKTKNVKDVSYSSLGPQAPGLEQFPQEQPELPEQLLPDEQGQALVVNEALTDLNDDKMNLVLFDENLNKKLDTFDNYNNSSSSCYNNSTSCDNNSYDFNIDDEADEVDFPGV